MTVGVQTKPLDNTNLSINDSVKLTKANMSNRQQRAMIVPLLSSLTVSRVVFVEGDIFGTGSIKNEPN